MNTHHVASEIEDAHAELAVLVNIDDGGGGLGNS